MKHAYELGLAWTFAGMLAAVAGIAAETSRTTTAAGPRAQSGARASATPRGVLPDPVLLDGSIHAAEKKSEYGMIGDFELPGDENNRNGRVGGGSGQQQDQAEGGGGGGQGKSGGGAPAAQTAKAGGGQEAAQTAQDGGSGQDPKSADKAGAGAGDPNAKPEGIRVAELGGDPSGAAGETGGQKPGPVAIGDKAMRIPQQTPNIAVIGAQQMPNQNTQVYEKPTGTGGKGPSATQGPNRTEKGRAIPAGL